MSSSYWQEYSFNPSNAEATFVQSTAMRQRCLKTILTLSCWYSLERYPWALRWIPMCQSFFHFSGFLHHFVLAKLAISSIRVKIRLRNVLMSLLVPNSRDCICLVGITGCRYAASSHHQCSTCQEVLPMTTNFWLTQTVEPSNEKSLCPNKKCE